jgi:hypothetical protein
MSQDLTELTLHVCCLELSETTAQKTRSQEFYCCITWLPVGLLGEHNSYVAFYVEYLATATVYGIIMYQRVYTLQHNLYESQNKKRVTFIVSINRLTS